MFKIVNPFSVQLAHKPVRASQYHRPLLRSIVPSMEIRVHSRLFLARYKGCTNARCILSRSYGHQEFKIANLFSVQKAHKVVRSSQYHRPLLRSIVPSMEILVHSRLFLARYKGCTNARCILSRSYGHEEFKNGNPFSVQNANKAILTSQYHHPLLRSIVLSKEIRVHSRLFPPRNKGCTNPMFILSRSYVHEEILKWKRFLGAKGAQSCSGQPISPSPAAKYSAVNGNLRTLATLPISVQRLH